jgi:hypothetical protein
VPLSSSVVAQSSHVMRTLPFWPMPIAISEIVASSGVVPR